jgi:hypothetical protein
MSRKVLDYSYARFSGTQIHNLGATAVCRYLTVVTERTKGKLLRRTESEQLSAAGVGIVSNFEYDAKDAKGGFDKGVEYAELALAQHAQAGGPAGRPIYFSVDWDVPDYAPSLPNTPEHAAKKLGVIADYFRGAGTKMGGQHLTGAYGGYWAIKRLFEAGLIGWGWQTSAWSGGRWHPSAVLRQKEYHGSYDVNYTDVDDFGQWRLDWTPATNGGAQPIIPADEQIWHKVKPGDTLNALAARYGTSAGAIKALNAGLIHNINHIEVGWNIRIK